MSFGNNLDDMNKEIQFYSNIPLREFEHIQSSLDKEDESVLFNSIGMYSR